MTDEPDAVPPEVVVLRMVGGPHAGDRHGPVSDLGGWPLPERLESPLLTSGYYRKVSESQLPVEVAAHPNLMRGAQYEWVEDGNGNDRT
jgi:hypothetical protein